MLPCMPGVPTTSDAKNIVRPLTPTPWEVGVRGRMKKLPCMKLMSWAELEKEQEEVEEEVVWEEKQVVEEREVED